MSVPALRFPEFEEEWEEETLAAGLSSLDAGVSTNSSDERAKDGQKGVLKTSCVTLGYFEPTENKLVDDPTEIDRLRENVQANSIIISRMNTPALVGANAFVDMDHANLFLPDRLWAAKIKHNHSPLWFAQLLANKPTRTALSARATGTSGSMKNLTKNDVFSLPARIPTLPEQKKIAAFLGAVDARIAGACKRRDLLETYKRGLMQALFSRTLRFTRDDGTAFPDWEEKRLGDVFAEVTEKVGEQDLPTYSISAGRGFVSQKEKFGKDISGQQNERYTALQIDEFAYNKGNSKSYKYGCIYPNNTDGTIAVPNVFISFRSIADKTSVRFYAKLFESHALDKGLRQIISSGARMDGLLNVSKKYFFELRVPHPYPEEQQKIADALSAMDAKIDAVAGQIAQLEAFKKGLLQQMFV